MAPMEWLQMMILYVMTYPAEQVGQCIINHFWNTQSTQIIIQYANLEDNR